MRKVILHVVLGLFLGAAVALIYLSSSLTFRQYLEQKIKNQFEQDYGCQLQATLHEIDWLKCSMTFSEVCITPDLNQKESWSILVETLHVTGSWLSLLLQGKLKVCLSLKHVIMMENFDQVPQKLMKFCSALFSQSVNTLILYDEISITDGLIYCKRLSDGFEIKMPYLCNMRTERLSTRMQLYIHDGSVGYSDIAWVQGIVGSILSDIPFENGFQNLSAQVQLNYTITKFEQEISGFLAGKLEHGIGEFSLKTQDGSIVVDPIKINFNDTACWCDVIVSATAQVLHYLQIPEIFGDVAGKVGLAVRVNLYDIFSTLQMSLVLNDVLYKSKPLIPGGKILITDHDKQGFSGIFIMNDEQKCLVQVAAYDKQVKCKIFNLIDLDLPFDASYKILKNNCMVDMVYESSGSIHGQYQIKVINQLLQKTDTLQGSFKCKDGRVEFLGTLNDLSYNGSFKLLPEYTFESFSATRNNNLVIDLSTDPQDPLYVVGSVDFSVIHDFIPEPFKMSFSQEGSLILRGYLKDGICGATVQTHYAHIRVPYIYNVIQNVTATCEFHLHEKNLVFRDIDVEWYEGKISCSQANVYFDKNFNWDFAHAPLMFHDVMLSWNKGVYGLVSGRILLHKICQSEPLRVEGQLMVQKAELKENIFSPEFQDIVSGIAAAPSCTHMNMQPYIDVSLFTQDPLKISTSFLTAQALVDVRVQGLLYKTDLSGSIKLLSGLFNFPFKSLEIVEGKILFLSEQSLFDPVIDFVAKGKLKRYGVTLKAWGSALDPHVQFESSPYLSEEQIVSLLLLGVEDQSLSLLVPAFLTQRLKDLIFGPAISNVKLKSVFDRLLQYLKYVRFIPQFTNQTGRGGVRGIFEVDATEHLQGKIDTNFAHLEDTKFDIDYAATDDVTLQLQKDGPSTYGGQVEFRWKFS